jgi:hypothetical protein
VAAKKPETAKEEVPVKPTADPEIKTPKPVVLPKKLMPSDDTTKPKSVTEEKKEESFFAIFKKVKAWIVRTLGLGNGGRKRYEEL